VREVLLDYYRAVSPNQSHQDLRRALSKTFATIDKVAKTIKQFKHINHPSRKYKP